MFHSASHTMKKLLPLLPLLFVGALFAEDAKPAPAAPAKTAPKGSEDLHGLMKAIAGDLKTVAKSLDDASAVDANRALIKTIIANAEKAKALTPRSADRQPEAKKEKFVADYKGEMDKLIADFGKIDAALAKKDFAAAKAALAECDALKKEDHRKFIAKKQR